MAEICCHNPRSIRTYSCVRGKAIYFCGSTATGMPSQQHVKPQNSPDRPTPSHVASVPRSHGRLCAKRRENKSAGPELPLPTGQCRNSRTKYVGTPNRKTHGLNRLPRLTGPSSHFPTSG